MSYRTVCIDLIECIVRVLIMNSCGFRLSDPFFMRSTCSLLA